MDSLTQIVLGAAVGEAALGRKIGNRAMLWGAIAGTIPDLDVMANAFLSPIDGLAFHRGISHSIFFAVIFSFFISKYTEWLYKNGHHKKQWFKLMNTILAFLFMIIIGVGITFINHFLSSKVGVFASATISLVLVAILGRRLIVNYYQKEQADINLSWKNWYILFFFAIFTHPILDCFTVYGTQLFAPFKNTRVSWDSISIVDPIYTLPFLLLLILGSFLTRKSQYRTIVNRVSLGLSTAYLLFTLWNKSKVNDVMTNTLDKEDISYSRFMTNPTIGNNILWSGVVESDSVFHVGMYSFNDKEKSFKLSPIPKNHHLIEEDETIKTLKWFSKGYYAILPAEKDTIYLIDMRYQSTDELDPNNLVFAFKLVKENGKYRMLEEVHPDDNSREGMFDQLINRIKGI